MEKYCFQESVTNGVVDWKLFICRSNEKLHKTLHFICQFKTPQNSAKIYQDFYFSVYATSILFVAATILVFASIKELRATVHGKNLLCLLIAVLITYVSFPLSYHGWVKDIRNISDVILTAGIYATFFWSTVLNFDVWWIFR